MSAVSATVLTYTEGHSKMKREITTLIAGHTFVEAPRWYQDRIWFSDLYTQRVLSAREDGSDLRVEAHVPEQPSGIDWLEDGRLIISSMRDRKVLRREHDGTIVVHADLADHVNGFCNEVLVDKQSRTYVGDFGFDLDNHQPMEPASITRIDPDGTITTVVDKEMWFPNGWVLTDDDVLIVNETFGNRISAFDLTRDGRLVNRRVWAEFGPLPVPGDFDEVEKDYVVCPDGMCIDAEGAIWIADLASEKLLRLRDGHIIDEIVVGMMPFSAVIGGADGHTMFICAAPNFDELERRSTTEARVLTTRLEIGARPTISSGLHAGTAP